MFELGNNALKKNIKNRLRRGGYASAKMRLSARQLLELRKILNSDTCTFDEILIPSNYAKVVEAVKNVAGEQSDGCEDSFTYPANALRLCQHIKELCDTKETFAWFDFIECFTTTFLRAHSWLNWVEKRFLGFDFNMPAHRLTWAISVPKWYIL